MAQITATEAVPDQGRQYRCKVMSGRANTATLKAE
jgi:hypothetical protein